jgi:tRNA(Ile)-lysidine synthase
LDDQVETMLYRMGRYGGLAALRGMLSNDPPWVRPLLGLRRADTAAFCRDKGLDFAVDRGNLYPGYARTGLREQVLPAWEAALPGAVEAAARTAEVAAEVERVVASVLGDLPFSLETDELDVFRVRALPPPLRRVALYAWLEKRVAGKVTRSSILAAEQLLFATGSGAVDVGQGWRICKDYDLLRVKTGSSPKTTEPGPADVLELSIPGRVVWGGVLVQAERADRFCVPCPAREVYLDAACVGSSLSVRSIRPGDRMRPLGAGGTRKLQDILVDLHIPVARRSRIPVVVSDGNIVWLCGLLSAEHGKITANTKELIRLTIEQEHSGHSS